MISSPVWPVFADLRIMANGWNETAAGFDPLRLDGNAPSYNYPRLWLLGGKLGWRTEDAPWLGVVTAALFLGAVFAVMRIAPGWTSLLALGLLASPAIGLGLERGNNDLLVFALITPALLIGTTAGSWRSPASPWLVILAGMLKLFPIVALPACLFRSGRSPWISALLGVLVFLVYLAANQKDVSLALAKTERGFKESYSLALTADALARGWAPRDTPTAEDAGSIAKSQTRQRTARWLAAGLMLAALAVTYARRTRIALLGIDTGNEHPSEAATRLFLGGASIFLVTFLFAHSWAYRLIFLLWTLPFLGHTLCRRNLHLRVWAGATLVLIGSVCWLATSNSPVGLWWAHVACLTLAPALVLLSGVALDAETVVPPPVPGMRLKPLFAAATAAAGVLLAGDTGASLTKQGFATSNMAETWQLVQQGRSAARDGRMQAAITHLEAALRLNPDHADAHAHLGAALWQSGRSAEAVQHLQQAIARQPLAIRARNTLAGVHRQQRRWDEAIAGYRESLAIRPDDIATLNQLGLTCLEAGRATEARQWLEQARALRPDHPETERNLGIVVAALGHHDQAAGHFKRALLLKPDYADAALQWGFMLARHGRLPEALAHFQQAVMLAPGSGQAHFVLAMALRELGRAAEGEAHYREAIRLDPSLAPR